MKSTKIKKIDADLYNQIDILFTDGTKVAFEADIDHCEPCIRKTINGEEL